MTLALAGPNPANAVAEALTNRDYISPTQIRLYQRCSLQWHFRYASDVEPAFVNSYERRLNSAAPGGLPMVG